MTQKKLYPKKHQNAFNAFNALNVHRRKNVPDRRLIKKKKAMEEVQKIGGQNALNALNALNVRHLKNMPRCVR